MSERQEGPEKVKEAKAPKEDEKSLSHEAFDAMKAGALAAAVAGLAAAKAGGDAAVKAGATAAVGGVGAVVGAEIAKENQKEIKAVINEIKKTPADVADHFHKRPVTAAAESIICPPLVIIDAKLRKLFGN